MNDGIEFRFVTRTLSEDYRVFYDNGRKQLGDIEEFAPIRKIGSIIPEEGPCAVLFEQDGKIYLAVSGMRRGQKDKAGRPIRFSFCRIYQKNNHTCSERAWNAFVRVITDWEAAENEISEDRQPPLIKIIPVTRASGSYGEDVEFDEKEFMGWLENSSDRIYDIKFSFVSRGRWSGDSFVNSQVWPNEGYIIKWNQTDQIAECIPSGKCTASRNDYEYAPRSSSAAPKNSRLQSIINIASRGMEILDEVMSSPPPSTMEQDRNKILGDIDVLCQKYSLTMTLEQKQAVQKAKELLAYALTKTKKDMYL